MYWAIRSPSAALARNAGRTDSNVVSRRFRRAAILLLSAGSSEVLIWQALPNPTSKGVFSVPDRNPCSCPPPSIIGARTEGRAPPLTKSAPTPFGPYILCELKDMRSTFHSVIKTGSLPTLCAASQWNTAPLRWLISTSSDRLNRSDFVVRRLNRNKKSALVDYLGRCLDQNPSRLVYREVNDSNPFRSGRSITFKNGFVLQRCCENAAPIGLGGMAFHETADGKVDTFGCAARETLSLRD